MTNEDLEQIILNAGFEDIILFDNYAYETAFIGISHDNRAVYDYDAMVTYLMDKENMSADEAVEWIEYNTIRALPYVPNSPIIVYQL